MISPCLPSAILQNLQFPHLLPFELIKKISWIFPSPGAENPIYPPVFAEIFPWLARGSHENRSKNKLVREKTLTRTHGSYRFGLWASDKITRGALFFIPRQIFTRVGYFWKSSNSKVLENFCFWEPESRPGEFCFMIRNTWSGIQVALFHSFSLVTKNPESSTWNLESLVWKPESKTVLGFLKWGK